MKKSKQIGWFLTLSISALLMGACSDAPKEEKATKEKPNYAALPTLQERKVAFGTNEEMDNIFRVYDEAVADVRKNPDDMEARIRLSEVFITEARITGKHSYNYDAALDVLGEVLASDLPNKDQRFRALMNKASVQLSLHKFGDALKTGEDALKINDRNAGIYGVLVDANVELGNYAKAVEMSDKMVSIRPDLRSYSRISYLREIHGDVAGAKEAMDMAVKAGYPGMEQTEWPGSPSENSTSITEI